MALPNIFEPVMEVLYTRLKAAGFPWAFTGSLGMALQGMTLEIHDIDLQSDEKGAYTIQALFPEFVTRPVIYYRAYLRLGRDAKADQIRKFLDTREIP